MQASILCFLVALTCVYSEVTNSSWIIFPGENGEPYTAILDEKFTITPMNHFFNTEDSLQSEDFSETLPPVKFHLYTRTKSTPSVQNLKDELKNDTIDPLKPTKIIIHGFASHGLTDWNLDLKNKFLQAEDCNVIAVDWSTLSEGPLYNYAKANSKPTGEYIGKMIQHLNEVGTNFSNVHCIGHSLGAHVCGFAGKAVSSFGKLGRITGLDPASPLFHFNRPLERLADTDAEYVDIIHTSTRLLGFSNPLGHTDFYPNGGSGQPGCGMDFAGVCSHARSHTFFAESILSHEFISHECESWKKYENKFCVDHSKAVMGNPANASVRGSYYLTTGVKSPFALGD